MSTNMKPFAYITPVSFIFVWISLLSSFVTMHEPGKFQNEQLWLILFVFVQPSSVLSLLKSA